MRKSMNKKTKELMSDFLDSLRDYIHESGNKLCFDKRSSKEFVNIYEKTLAENTKQKKNKADYSTDDDKNIYFHFRDQNGKMSENLFVKLKEVPEMLNYLFTKVNKYEKIIDDMSKIKEERI